MPEWLNVLWVIAAWPVANLLVCSIADRPRSGRTDPGPNWWMLVWAPAYLRWRRARLAKVDKRWNPPTPGAIDPHGSFDSEVLRPDHVVRPPVCPRCGLHHAPADWLEETCPYASPADSDNPSIVRGSE